MTKAEMQKELDKLKVGQAILREELTMRVRKGVIDLATGKGVQNPSELLTSVLALDSVDTGGEGIMPALAIALTSIIDKDVKSYHPEIPTLLDNMRDISSRLSFEDITKNMMAVKKKSHPENNIIDSIISKAKNASDPDEVDFDEMVSYLDSLSREDDDDNIEGDTQSDTEDLTNESIQKMLDDIKNNPDGSLGKDTDNVKDWMGYNDKSKLEQLSEDAKERLRKFSEKIKNLGNKEEENKETNDNRGQEE